MKILHISDLHFGMHQEHIAQAFLNDLSLSKPDLILISGDLTQRATTDEYEIAATFFKKLNCKFLIVPGNHDIPLYNIFARFVAPYTKYQKYISSELSGHFENEAVRMLGVNSVNPFRVKEGKLTQAALKRIKNYFEPDFKGVNILFFHHNFDYQEGLHKPLENYLFFLQYLKESPIDFVCTGHSHYANVSVLEKEDEKACVILHSGSLLCTRRKDGLNSYYEIEIEQRLCKVNWRVFNKTSFHTQNSFNMDLSKNFPDLQNILSKM